MVFGVISNTLWLQRARVLKEAGNALYKGVKYDAAIDRYTEALGI